MRHPGFCSDFILGLYVRMLWDEILLFTSKLSYYIWVYVMHLVKKSSIKMI